jgi:hypothetical protein
MKYTGKQPSFGHGRSKLTNINTGTGDDLES